MMFFDLCAYIIIPLYTIAFVRNTNWFTTNFSVISSYHGRQAAFWIWGFLIGSYFYYSLKKVIQILPRSKKETALAAASMTLLALAVCTPYLPGEFPFRSFLHVVSAFTSAVLFLLCLFLTTWSFYRRDRPGYRSYMTGLWGIAAGSLFLLWAAGIVSSALEIFFVVSCSILVRKLHKKVLSNQLRGPF